MKFFVVLFLTVIVAFIVMQGYRLAIQQVGYLEEAQELKEKTDAISVENAKLVSDVEFYQNAANAAKELQSKVNYKKPGEQMIILVPEE